MDLYLSVKKNEIMKFMVMLVELRSPGVKWSASRIAEAKITVLFHM